MSTGRLRLYEIAAEWRLIDQAIEEMDGEVPPEILARMDELSALVPETVDAVAKLVREREAEAGAYHAESQHFAAKAKACQAAADRLKAYLRHHIEACGLDRVKGALFRVALVKNGRPSIRWPGRPEGIPLTYRRISIDLDGPAAYADWKNGTLPEGFEVEHGSHLRIT